MVRIIYGSQSQTDIGENDVKSIIGGVYFSVRNGVNGGPRLPMRFPTVEFNNGNGLKSAVPIFSAGLPAVPS